LIAIPSIPFGQELQKMASDLADAIEEAKAEFLHADIFRLIKELLSLRLLYLTGTLKPPRAARLKLLRTYDDETYAHQRFYCRAQISLSVGRIIRVFFLANAIARSIDRLIPLDFCLDRYSPQIRDAIESGQQQTLKVLRYGMFGPLLPKETWRQILTYSLTTKTLEWILAHETAHIMNGHIEMPKKLRELPWVSQIIESQADDFATGRVLIRIRTVDAKHDYSQGPTFDDVTVGFAYCRLSDRINITLVAMLLSFVIIGNNGDAEFLETAPSPELRWKEYPPAVYRLWRAMNLLTTPLRTNPGMPPLRPLNPVEDGIVLPGALISFVNDIIGQISYRRQPFSQLLPMHQSMIRNYDHTLMENLAPVAAYEANWRARNLDPNRPSPKWPLS
jgi:hypothetical protein